MTLYQYSGTGSLVSVATLLEKNSYSYNQSSISQTTEDGGLIINALEFQDDYGQINQSSGPIVDYGLTSEVVSGIVYPFGGLTLGGSAITQPNYRLFFSGTSIEKVIYSPNNTSGTLFNIGQQEERRSYAYNESSFENTELDYGLISQVTSLEEDYQDISSVGILVEYGLIIETSGGIITPFGELTLSGSALTEPNYRLFLSGQAIVKTSYIPEITYGTLFGFGEKLESITYDYNSSSIYENSLDYGSITSPQLGGPDYGVITGSSGNNPSENYGLVTETIQVEVSTPFGISLLYGSAITSEIATYTKVASGTLTLSGSALESYSAQTPEDLVLYTFSGSALESDTESYVGLGTLTLSGSALESYSAQTPEDLVLYTFSGSALESDTESYVGSGTLFSFGEKLESVTYDYSEESITINSLDDFGSVSVGYTISTDCGLIVGAIDDGIDNYGLLVGNPFASTPFGSILISGSTVESFDEGPYTTSGSITIFGDSITEKFTADTPDNTQLFQISGSALTSNIDVYIGIGTLFNFGEKLESVTYDYNESSISDNEDDFGLISNLNSQFIDYGFITGSSGNNPSENYGLITEIITNPFDNPFDGTLTLSGSLVERQTDSYVGIGQITLSGELVHPNIDYTPSPTGSGFITLSGSALESDTESYVGLGTLTLSGSALESYSAQTPEDLVLYTFSGSALESYSAQTPEDLVLYTFSGSALESDTESYVGLGTLTLSGFSIERVIESYVGLGTLLKLGEKIEKRTYSYNELSIAEIIDNGLIIDISDTIIDNGLIIDTTNVALLDNGLIIGQLFKFGTLTLSGSALESYSAQTPEDTILYTFSGSALESDTESYVGLGTLTLSGSALESYSAQIPEDTQLFTISGSALEVYSAQTPEDTQLFTISGSSVEKFTADTPEDTILYQFNGLARTYSPIYPRNAIPGDPGSGIGTFKFNEIDNIAKYSPLTPYKGNGGILVSGIGLESFSITNYNGSGSFTFSGISSNREIDVYQDYVTSGVITISQQTQSTIEKSTESYVAIGTIIKFGTLSDERIVNDYTASGNINLGKINPINQTDKICSNSEHFGSSTATFDSTLKTFDIFCDSVGIIVSSALESYSAQTPEDTQLLNISGSALEVYSAQTPEDTQLFNINGNIVESISYGYFGAGQATFGSAAKTKFEPRHIGKGGLRFTTHLSDNLYDTCDSVDITSDYLNSAFVSFIANPLEDTQLFKITGSASTSEINYYEYVGVGNLTFSGSLVERETDSYVSIGTLFTFLGGNEVDVNSYRGSGSLFAISGSSESKSFKTPENTILINISGTASTKLEYEYSYSGIGTVYISGSASTRFEVDYPYSGIGTVYISGSASTRFEVDYPYSGIGSVYVSGSASTRLESEYSYSGIGSVYVSGSASTRLESEYSYSGIGSVYVSGSALIVFESDYPYFGIGSITLSGELVYPDIRFVPTPKGDGLLTFSGISSNSISRIGILSGNQTLFTFSGGFESFSQSTYIGLGTIYIQQVSGVVINNPFQIPRTYVVII